MAAATDRPAAPWLRAEDAILENVRRHLRHAAGDSHIKRLTFHLTLNHGQVTRDEIEVDFQYCYVNSSAL